jgi:polar amino acid transport system ATP-binding protein
MTIPLPEKAPAILEIRNLWKSFGALQVLQNIDLTVARGEVVVIIGPSGSGKSTLLSCINCLEPFEWGECTIDGTSFGHKPDKTRIALSERQLNAYRSRIGIVFQQFNLFPHMTVLENIVEAPIHVKQDSRDVVTARAYKLLDKVGLRDKADVYPAQLSGGQQQRVAIARALAMEPVVMLFDEVTSALDPELVGEVLSVMRGLTREGMTMIIVTHEMAFARDVADRIVFMDGGSIVEQGDPATIFSAPEHPRTQAFLAKFIDDTSNTSQSRPVTRRPGLHREELDQ